MVPAPVWTFALAAVVAALSAGLRPQPDQCCGDVAVRRRCGWRRADLDRHRGAADPRGWRQACPIRLPTNGDDSSMLSPSTTARLVLRWFFGRFSASFCFLRRDRQSGNVCVPSVQVSFVQRYGALARAVVSQSCQGDNRIAKVAQRGMELAHCGVNPAPRILRRLIPVGRGYRGVDSSRSSRSCSGPRFAARLASGVHAGCGKLRIVLHPRPQALAGYAAGAGAFSSTRKHDLSSGRRAAGLWSPEVRVVLVPRAARYAARTRI